MLDIRVVLEESAVTVLPSSLRRIAQYVVSTPLCEPGEANNHGNNGTKQHVKTVFLAEGYAGTHAKDSF